MPAAAMARLWGRTSTLREIWDLILTVERWPDVAVAADGNGLCFTVGGATIAHVRWNGRTELPFTPDLRDRLVAEEMANRDPDDPDAEHVVFNVRSAADFDHAIWLLRIAYLTVDSR
jgi:hypothetical protein